MIMAHGHRVATVLRLVLALCVMGALGACAPALLKPEDQAALVWPDIPNPPRIAYVKQFSKPDDFDISKGFFQRLGELIFGPNQDVIDAMDLARKELVRYPSDSALVNLVAEMPQRGAPTLAIRGRGPRVLHSAAKVSGFVLRNPRVRGCFEILRGAMFGE